MGYYKSDGVVLMRYVLMALLSLLITYTVEADVVMGNPKGNITVVEFYDYQCPHCHVMAPTIDKLMQQNANVRVVYRPIAALTPLSSIEAASVLAAAEQGKFRVMHRALMTNYVASMADVLALAKSLHLDTNALIEAMQSERIQSELRQNLELFYATKSEQIPLILIGTEQHVVAVHHGEVSYEVLQSEVA